MSVTDLSLDDGAGAGLSMFMESTCSPLISLRVAVMVA